MGKRKEYNPNSYNALDAALAFIIILTIFLVVGQIARPIIRSIRDNTENFDYYLFLCIDLLISESLILVVALIFSKVRKVSLFSGGGFVYKFDVVQILFAILLMFGIYLLFNYAHLQFDNDLYEIFYGMDINEYSESRSEMTGNFSYMLLYAFVIGPLLPCICEEILFRGIIMRGLRQFGLVFSIIVSSLCFAFMHGNIAQIILQFLGGLSIAAVVTLTGNFLLGAVMHFVNNLFVYVFNIVILSFDYRYYLGAEYVEAMQIIFGVVCLVASATYFINLAVAKAKKSALNKPEEIKLKDVDYYAKVRAKNETVWQIVYPVQVDFDLISNGEYLYESKGKEIKVNKKSNSALSMVFIAVGLIYSIVLIILSI